MNFERMRATLAEDVERNNFKEWNNVDEYIASDIYSFIKLKAELNYDFTVGDSEAVCEINKHIQIIDNSYSKLDVTYQTHITNQMYGEPILIKYPDLNVNLFVVYKESVVLFIIYGYAINANILRYHMDHIINKFIKTQIHQKSSSSTVDTKTIHDMLKSI